MLVGNFTPDDIHWEHLGQMGDLKSGTVEDFFDARANFILTKWGPRGLVKVEWEDREDLSVYHERAMRIYRNFWELQIETFNQQNEQKKNENKAYVYPTKQLSQKGEELGFEIVGPWKAVQKTDSAELRQLKSENAALKSELGELRENVTELLGLMKEVQAKPAIPVPIDTDKILKQFQHLGKDRYDKWVIEHLGEIPDYPMSVYENAFEKWSNFYKKDPWPVEKCRSPK